jgi:pyrroloquinoline quinone (PQQ) biosynthesis protein C
MPPAEVAQTASARVRRKLELLVPALVRAGDRLIDHPAVGELYPEYLFTSHCVIRASVPLMETALARARAAQSDPVSAALAPYLEEHIDEERDHDEWLLDDLEVLGLDRGEVLARPPSPIVAAMVGAQYYWIFHYHPVVLLGYVSLLEGYPPSTELIERLIRATGYPREAFRTMIGHAELDPHHRDELNDLLDSLPLTEEQSTALGLNALYTVDAFTRAVDELLAERVANP